MTTYTVTAVRKEESSDGTHKHLEGVITDAGTHYTRKEVVDSIDKGHVWETSADGYTATIEKMKYCPAKDCLATPYIKTNPDSTKRDNLDNLPED
jgi:Protein of unknown function (DUF3892)